MNSDNRLVMTCFVIVLGVGLVAVCLVTFGSAGLIGWAGMIAQETGQVVALTQDVQQTEAWSTFNAQIAAEKATERAYQREAENAQTLLEEAKDWEVVISDGFDTNANDWLDDSVSYDLLTGDIHISEGKYYWDLEAKDGFVYYSYPDIEVLTDFYIEVEAEQSMGPVYASYGLIFRYASGSYYYNFTITEDQRYEVYLLRAGDWEAIISPTFSEAIQPGQVNKLAIIVIQSNLYFFINDTFVNFVDSDVLIRGRAGVTTGLRLEGETAQFVFDNFEIRVPPGEDE